MTTYQWYHELVKATVLAQADWWKRDGDPPASINSKSAVMVKRALAKLIAANRKRHGARAKKEA